MEVDDGNNEPSLPFAYLGPNHPTIYFPDSARPALLFHRSLLRPHAVILSKTTKVAGASLDLKASEEPASATDIENIFERQRPACEVDQTKPDETNTGKPAFCLDDGRFELKKKKVVEASS